MIRYRLSTGAMGITAVLSAPLTRSGAKSAYPVALATTPARSTSLNSDASPAAKANTIAHSDTGTVSRYKVLGQDSVPIEIFGSSLVRNSSMLYGEKGRGRIRCSRGERVEVGSVDHAAGKQIARFVVTFVLGNLHTLDRGVYEFEFAGGVVGRHYYAYMAYCAAAAAACEEY